MKKQSAAIFLKKRDRGKKAGTGKDAKPSFCRGSDVGGFTLLELMITISLLAIVALIVAGALRIGIRAWEKGSQREEEIQSTRVVLDILKRQISSALPHEIKMEGKTSYIFVGDEKQLQFTSIFPLSQQDNIDSALVTYQVTGDEKKNLEFIEERLATADFLNPGRLEDSDNWKNLAENVGYFSFQYTGELENDEEIVWETSWNAKERKALPVAVKLTMETDTDQMPIEMVVRLPVKNVWATLQP